MMSKDREKKDVLHLIIGIRLWLNSLGVEGVEIFNLYYDFKDGIILLKIMDCLL